MEDVILKIVETSTIGGMLGMLIWWMTTRHEKLVLSLIKQQAATNILVVGLQKALLIHDLTVTGINPSLGDTDAVRDSKALAKYTELITILGEIEKRISAI
jgi:hypothetical protein